MRAYLAFTCVLHAAFALGCDRRPDSGHAPAARPSAQAAASAAVASAASSPTQAPAARRPQHPAERVLSAWSTALNQHDDSKLAPLYAPHVRFYGVRKTAAEVLGAKRQAFSKEPDYRQRLGDVRIEKTAKGFSVRFKKESGADFALSVAARLELEGTPDNLLITEESDSVTDERFKKKAPPATCYGAVVSVIPSLPAIEADMRRVARTNPGVSPGGILYSEEAGNVQAAQGYFHPDRFEPRWWIDVVNGELTIRDALSDEALALPDSARASVRQACSAPEADAGTKRK
jgi:hypothetical protein